MNSGIRYGETMLIKLTRWLFMLVILATCYSAWALWVYALQQDKGLFPVVTALLFLDAILGAIFHRQAFRLGIARDEDESATAYSFFILFLPIAVPVVLLHRLFSWFTITDVGDLVCACASKMFGRVIDLLCNERLDPECKFHEEY